MYKILYIAIFSAFIRQIEFLKQMSPASILKIFIFINMKNIEDLDYPKLFNIHKQKLSNYFENDVNKLVNYVPNISNDLNF